MLTAKRQKKKFWKQSKEALYNLRAFSSLFLKKFAGGELCGVLDNLSPAVLSAGLFYVSSSSYAIFSIAKKTLLFSGFLAANFSIEPPPLY